MTLTPLFGLLAQDDLVFLHQQDGGVCLTPGLSRLESSFPSPPPAKRCPHKIPTSPPTRDLTPPRDPLLDVLRPVPDGGVYWAPKDQLPLIRDAHMMASPVGLVIFPMWATDVHALVPLLDITNLAPMIIVGYERKHLQKIVRLLELPHARTILFCGDFAPPGATPVRSATEIDPNTDWRAAGAAALHEHVLEIVERARAYECIN